MWLNCLFKGSYGTVHRAILKENELEVAIKKVQVDNELHDIIKGDNVPFYRDSV